jgi:hypothetical protein
MYFGKSLYVPRRFRNCVIQFSVTSAVKHTFYEMVACCVISYLEVSLEKEKPSRFANSQRVFVGKKPSRFANSRRVFVGEKPSRYANSLRVFIGEKPSRFASSLLVFI